MAERRAVPAADPCPCQTFGGHLHYRTKPVHSALPRHHRKYLSISIPLLEHPQSHEQDTFNQVIQQLSAQYPPLQTLCPLRTQKLPHRVASTHLLMQSATVSKIAELECQLAQLRDEREQERATMEGLQAPGMYNPCPSAIPHPSGSASGIAGSVVVLCPDIKRSTLVQIIENWFRPTNIQPL